MAVRRSTSPMSDWASGTPLSAQEEAVVAMYIQAFEDPDYHRRLERRRGSAKPLRPLQVRIIKDIEGLISDGSGHTMTIRLPRQYGKNEIAATIHERHLMKRCVEGGSIVRAAPTFRPQIVNSVRRLQKVALNDPLFDMDRFSMKQGFIAEYGQAEVIFLSSDSMANVEGATANVLLDMDEAHRTDRKTYEEKFVPMTASTNAPQLLWGVAGDKTDLLYWARMRNFEMGLGDRNIQVSASVISESDPVYAAHYQNRVDRLGADHPVVETQYNLVDLDALGGAFKLHHRASLFDSDHDRQSIPSYKSYCSVITVIDLAGEEESEDKYDEAQRDKGESPDNTVIINAEVDRSDVVGDKPKIRVLDATVMRGLKMQGVSGDSSISLQEALIENLNRWQPDVTVIDAKGIGHSTASWLERVWHGTVCKYSATAPSASEDIFATYAWLNLGQMKWWRDDGSREYKQMVQEMSWTERKVTRAEQINIMKPHKRSDKKIDMVKALTYLPRAVGEVSVSEVFGFSARL
jgi:hypothetical protein